MRADPSVYSERWEGAERHIALEGREAGLTDIQISMKLPGRSEAAVNHFFRKHHAAKKGKTVGRPQRSVSRPSMKENRKIRDCLGAGCQGKANRKFMSPHAGHRLCHRCKKYADHTSSSMM